MFFTVYIYCFIILGIEHLLSAYGYLNKRRNYGGDVTLFNLLTSKLPYPYTFMDSPERFKEELPPIEAFFNDLTNSPCSNDDYIKVKKVFESFNLETLGDLTKLYSMKIICYILMPIISTDGR